MKTTKDKIKNVLNVLAAVSLIITCNEIIIGRRESILKSSSQKNGIYIVSQN